MSLIVNLFGCPGSGKSTLSADIFSRLKKLNVNAELVQEYMKELIWDDRVNTFNDQLYITAKQNRRLSRLQGKVDVIVTDSPLPLGAIYSSYSSHPHADLINNVTSTLFSEYRNLNVFIPKQFTHVQTGRIHTESDSAQIEQRIVSWFAVHKYQYVAITQPQDIDKLVEIICAKLLQ